MECSPFNNYSAQSILISDVEFSTILQQQTHTNRLRPTNRRGKRFSAFTRFSKL